MALHTNRSSCKRVHKFGTAEKAKEMAAKKAEEEAAAAKKAEEEEEAAKKAEEAKSSKATPKKLPKHK